MRNAYLALSVAALLFLSVGASTPAIAASPLAGNWAGSLDAAKYHCNPMIRPGFCQTGTELTIRPDGSVTGRFAHGEAAYNLDPHPWKDQEQITDHIDPNSRSVVIRVDISRKLELTLQPDGKTLKGFIDFLNPGSPSSATPFEMHQVPPGQ